jgi:pantoate--beta-alanine ligase
MQIIEDPNKMQELAMRLRTEGKLIALVSTSGALHEGHAALVRRAREEADLVVLSAFVNPLEFGPNEDFQRYPRSSAEDADFCEREGVDILFRPAARDLFPDAFSMSVNEESISTGLCGISRPHYFKGVCTLHAILFNLVRPDHLVLGQRDAQKVAVLKKLVEELQFPVSVFVEPTVRAEDGLACNARNTYMNEFQRRDSVTIYKALLEGKKLADQGIRNVDRIMAEVTHHISQMRRLRVIYVAAVDPATMEPIRPEIIPGHTLLITAVWCDEVRLVDNILL